MNKETQAVLFSSDDMNAVTPQDFFEQLNHEFNFAIDLAADGNNSKCPHYFDEEVNALVQDWLGRCWCNPPYGRTIGKWVEKAAEESEKNGTLIVMLLPARTDTRWFTTISDTADEIRFVKGRLKFEGEKNSAPFPSMVAIWYGNFLRVGKQIEGEYNWNLIWRR